LNRFFKIYHLIFIILFLSSTTILAQFYCLETKDLNLVYFSKAHEYVVPHLARCFENSLRFHSSLFNYKPSEKVTILLQNFSDYGNAGAETVPHNFINLCISPVNFVFETVPSNERMNTTMNHELVHIVTMDKAASSDKFFRSIFFGKVSPVEANPTSILYSYLTNPRRLTPRWYLEGIATFLETWMAGGIGRAMGSYDEMVFRTMVCDNSFFYDIISLESEGTTSDFQVGANSYLYGTRFISYIAYQYGVEKLIDWYNRDSNSKTNFASQFNKVFGIHLNKAWSQWIDWEHRWQKSNLDSIRSNPTTPFREISKRKLGSVSRAYYDQANNKLLVAVRYPGQIAHIASIDIMTGQLKKICPIKGPALYYVSSLAYDQKAGTIFYTTDNNKWRDLNSVNTQTGKSKRLIKDVKTGDLAFNQIDQSLWGVRHLHGLSTLVRIPYPHKDWNQIHTFPYGKDLFDIDISPDGTILTGALALENGTQKLIKMDIDSLLKGNASYQIIFDFENSTPANFVFSSDGKYLFGSSYYSGVSNIYRYDFEKELMEIISNCETGFFRPIPISEDSLIVFRYTGKGFNAVMIANQPPEYVSAINFLGNEIVKKQPIVRDWIVGSPARINIDSLTTYSGKYNTLSHIGISSIIPIVEGYKDFPAYGLRFDLSNRIRLTRMDLTASYSPNQILPDDERIHLDFNLHHWNWQLRGSYNNADFYDLFGPTKTSRKGYSAGVQYYKNLLFDEPKTLNLKINLDGYGDLERLPDYQKINATFDKLLTFKSSLNYQFIWKSLGAVDEEKGIRWQLHFRNNYVNKENYPFVFTNFDYGIPLAINHSSIWLRSSIGNSFGDRNNPFANFFFGGFGNNWVDHQTEKRYREYYSFPGTELNAIGGKNYGKAMLEWNLPPLRFRHLGFPTFYFNWARLALFTSAIQTNFDKDNYRATFYNFGAQVDFQMVLFFNLPSTLSFGYAGAIRENQPLEKANTEFMVSLKIL
jgi:hypothetical protein